jgi:hypothetical protein
MSRRDEDVAMTDIEVELGGAEFGDARLSARQLTLAARLAAGPGQGLPECIQNDSQLECSYRFLSNARVTPDRILEPHQNQTYQRIAQRKEALAVHDTTELEFGGEREGLGPLSSGRREGFFLHLTLAVTADGNRQALGTLAQRYWTRTGESRSKSNGRRLNGQASSRRPERESLRWVQQVQQVEANKPEGVSLIHVGDRETDAYEMLEAVQSLRYVLRANHDRRVFDDDQEPTHLRQACERADVVLTFEVAVPPRKAPRHPGTAARFPAREARMATVSVRALSVSLRQPYVRNGEALQVNVVYAREATPPADTQPIDWVLYTSEPVDTPEQLLQVLEWYRARWVIEEFFKALKTGCEVQKLQLETYEALRNAVALHLPIAWQILLLRSLARVQPEAPAEQVLTRTQLDVLRAFARRPLNAQPTVQQAMLAIAILGGYLITKAKTPPGWITLGRGMQRLLTYEQGWSAGQAAARQPKDPLEH